MLLISVLLVACSGSNEIEVPMIALIANPERYEGRDVKTYGFLKVQDRVGLFVHRDDVLFGNWNHAVPLTGPICIGKRNHRITWRNGHVYWQDTRSG